MLKMRSTINLILSVAVLSVLIIRMMWSDVKLIDFIWIEGNYVYIFIYLQGSPRPGYGSGPPMGPSQVPHQMTCSPRIGMPQHTGMNMPPPQGHVAMAHHYQSGILLDLFNVIIFIRFVSHGHTHTHTPRH